MIWLNPVRQNACIINLHAVQPGLSNQNIAQYSL